MYYENARSRSLSPRRSFFLPEGRVFHLGVREGEVNNRILTVGHSGRADVLKELLDSDRPILSLQSTAHFRIYSGFYKGGKVSILSTGMGSAMVDLALREISYVTRGPLAIIRLGTCSLLNPGLRPGCLVIASKGSIGVYHNYAFFDGIFGHSMENRKLENPYIITQPCLPDRELSSILARNARSTIRDSTLVYEGLNASCETFYSCQGRIDNLFNDYNDKLLPILSQYRVDSMEMEAHQLFHLSNRRKEPIRAAAAHIGIINRLTQASPQPIITAELLNRQVHNAGRACLDSLISIPL